MLTCPLLDASLVHTPAGWSPCSTVSEVLDVLGVDRHGRPAFAEVTVRPGRSTDTIVFLGTSRSCGFFAGDSVIQTSRGHQHRAEEFLDASIGETNFEAILTSADRPRIAPPHALWHLLGFEAANEDGDSLFIRARRPLGEAGKPPPDGSWRFERKADRVYGVLRSAFKSRPEVARDFIDGLVYLFTNEDGICEFGRRSSILAMAVATYYAGLDRPTTFQYDSLQHSAIIGLAVGRSDTNAVPRGLCGCAIAETATLFELGWDDPAWNPIVSGFIASAARS